MVLLLVFGVVAIGYGVSGFLGYGLQTQSGVLPSGSASYLMPFSASGYLNAILGPPMVMACPTWGCSSYPIVIHYELQTSYGSYYLLDQSGLNPAVFNLPVNHTLGIVTGYLQSEIVGPTCILTVSGQQVPCAATTYWPTTSINPQTYHAWFYVMTITVNGSTIYGGTNMMSQTTVSMSTNIWTVTNCYGQIQTGTVYPPPYYYCAISSTTTPIITTTVTQGGSTTTITQPACTSTITVTLTSGVPPPPLALPMNGSCYVFVYGSQNSFWQSLASILIGFTSIGIAFVVRR